MTNFKHVALSSFAAIAFSAACVGAALAPASAAAPAAAGAWQAAIERKLDTQADRYAVAMPSGTKAEAVLAVRFTADGDYAGADIARSSGDRRLDAHALNVAARLAYPRMPEAMRGQPRTLAMRLVFGRADDAVQMAALERNVRTDTRLASANGAGGDEITAK